MMDRHFSRFVLTASALALAWSAAAYAQVSKQDKGELIKGMQQENMTELLEHFAATAGLDSAQQQQWLVAQKVLRAGRLESEGKPAEALATLEEALQAQRKLIADAEAAAATDATKEELRLPMWQTALGEMLLFEYLRMHDNAARAYEFGLPNPAQAKAFESASREALALLEKADASLGRLEIDVRRLDLIRQAGLEQALVLDCGQQRTPGFLALAAYYVSLIPGTPPETRTALLNKASAKVRLVLGASYFVCLSGRVQVAQGKFRPALETLAQVSGGGDPIDALARLAELRALDGLGQTAQLRNRLDELFKSHELFHFIAGPPRKDVYDFRFLAADLLHRLAVERAKTLPDAERDKALAAAYQPYVDLINAPEIPEDMRGWVKNEVFRRWQSGSASNDPDQLQPVVVQGLIYLARAAAGEHLQRVNPLMESIEALRQSGAGAGQIQAKEREVEALRARARPSLEQAIRLGLSLLGRKDVDPATSAQAMLELGEDYYNLAPNDQATLMKALDQWLDAGEKLPQEKASEEAMGKALTLIRWLHEHASPETGRLKGLEERFDRAMKIAVGRNSARGVDQILYYGHEVLQPRDDFEEMALLYPKVPPAHETYNEAQRELAYAYLALARKAREAGQPAEVERLETSAGQTARHLVDMLEALAGAPPQEDPEREKERIKAKRNSGHARLVLADVALARNNPRAAVQALDNWEREFSADNRQDRELLREGLGKRILALYRDGQFDDAVAAAATMMDQFPDQAAIIIESVLRRIDGELVRLDRAIAEAKKVNDLAKAAADERARASLTRAALALAERLVQWGQASRQPEDRMRSARLLLAQAYRLNDRVLDAIQIVQPLFDDPANKNDALVLHHMAESLFAAKDPAKRAQALQIYGQLKDRSPYEDPDKPGQTIYPWYFWNSRMRVYQIMDMGPASGATSNDIWTGIQGLRIISPMLGGEPYRSELLRLELLHSTRRTAGGIPAASAEAARKPARPGALGGQLVPVLFVLGGILLVAVIAVAATQMKARAARQRAAAAAARKRKPSPRAASAAK